MDNTKEAQTNCAVVQVPRTFRQRIEMERDWAIKSLSLCQRKLDLFDSLDPQTREIVEEMISI